MLLNGELATTQPRSPADDLERRLANLEELVRIASPPNPARLLHSRSSAPGRGRAPPTPLGGRPRRPVAQRWFWRRLNIDKSSLPTMAGAHKKRRVPFWRAVPELTRIVRGRTGPLASRLIYGRRHSSRPRGRSRSGETASGKRHMNALPVEVLVVDDHPIVRLGIVRLNDMAWHDAVFEQVEVVTQARERGAAALPEPVTLDLSLLDAQGTEGARARRRVLRPGTAGPGPSVGGIPPGRGAVDASRDRHGAACAAGAFDVNNGMPAGRRATATFSWVLGLAGSNPSDLQNSGSRGSVSLDHGSGNRRIGTHAGRTLDRLSKCFARRPGQARPCRRSEHEDRHTSPMQARRLAQIAGAGRQPTLAFEWTSKSIATTWLVSEMVSNLGVRSLMLVIALDKSL